MKKRKENSKLLLKKISISKLSTENSSHIYGGGPEVSEQVCSYNCASAQQTACETGMCTVTNQTCPEL